MTTRSFVLLITLCCTLLLAVSAVSPSAATPRSLPQRLNLGLATEFPLVRQGSTVAFAVSEQAQHRDLNGDGDFNDFPLHVFDALTGEARNLGLDGFPQLFMGGRLVAFWASEISGADLNGDGDRMDAVLHLYDTARRSLTNLRVAGTFVSEDTILFDGRRLAFSVGEVSQGTDLNRDGDAIDSVLHAFDVITGQMQNTGLAVALTGPLNVAFEGRWIAVAVPERTGNFFTESGQSRDLNGDGDTKDIVLQLFDTATRRATNLSIAVPFFPFQAGFKVGNNAGMVLVGEADQGMDLNGDRDLEDVVLHSIELAPVRVRNTGFTVANLASDFSEIIQSFAIQEGFVFFNRAEADARSDLNGDGDREDVALQVLETRSGRVRSLNVAALVLPSPAPGRAVLFMVESNNGKDFNGDGDQQDSIFALADVRGNEPRVLNTRRQFSFASDGTDIDFLPIPLDPIPLQLRDDLFTFIVSEAAEGNRDLNDDGDATDFLLQIADLSTGTVRNTRLSGAFTYRTVQAPLLRASNGLGVLAVEEERQGRDLNGDGDLRDMVLQLIDVRSGASRNTGFTVASVPSRVSGESADLFVNQYEVPLLIRGQSFESALVREEDVDLNGDGDREDLVLHFFDIPTGKITNTGFSPGEPKGSQLSNLVFAFAALGQSLSILGVSSLNIVPTVEEGPGLGDAYAFLVSEAAQGNVDLNGDGDTDDLVVHATRLTDRDRNGRFDFTEEGGR